jgi:hypothetical protein
MLRSIAGGTGTVTAMVSKFILKSDSVIKEEKIANPMKG